MTFDDVIIVGAGPAGALAACQAAQGRSVTLIDPSYDRAVVKPCGGLLSEAAQAALARLAITLPASLMVTPQAFAVDVIDLETKRGGRYAHTYLNVDRALFDAYLRTYVPPSVETVAARVTHVVRVPGGVRLTLRENGRLTERLARTVVAADGARSIVRRHLYPNRPATLLTAVQGWYRRPAEALKRASEYACYYDRRLTPAYGWSLAKDDHVIVGGAFERQSARDAFCALERAVFSLWGCPVAERVRQEACGVVWARRAADVCLGADGAYLVGEAAGLISPSSLEGLSFALLSGAALGRALALHLDARYPQWVRALVWKRWRRAIKTHLLASPAFRRCLFVSRVGQTSRAPLGRVSL